MQWHTSAIPALKRPKKEDQDYEFKASLHTYIKLRSNFQARLEQYETLSKKLNKTSTNQPTGAGVG